LGTPLGRGKWHFEGQRNNRRDHNSFLFSLAKPNVQKEAGKAKGEGEDCCAVLFLKQLALKEGVPLTDKPNKNQKSGNIHTRLQKEGVGSVPTTNTCRQGGKREEAGGCLTIFARQGDFLRGKREKLRAQIARKKRKKAITWRSDGIKERHKPLRQVTPRRSSVPWRKPRQTERQTRQDKLR